MMSLLPAAAFLLGAALVGWAVGRAGRDLSVRSEREACAQIAAAAPLDADWGVLRRHGALIMRDRIARAIRVRGGGAPREASPAPTIRPLPRRA